MLWPKLTAGVLIQASVALQDKQFVGEFPAKAVGRVFVDGLVRARDATMHTRGIGQLSSRSVSKPGTFPSIS